MNTLYYPELNEAKPDVKIEVGLSYLGGGKRRIVSQHELPAMRGLTKERVYCSEDLTPYAQHKVGHHVYTATARAFGALSAQYDMCQPVLLD